MIKTLKNLRIGVWGLLGFCGLWFGVSSAQERGIGVTPAKIEVGQNVEWPYTFPITVTNLSSETENFEVTFDKDEDTIVSVSPGRFSLDALVSARVLVAFDPPAGGAAEGIIEVVSTRTSPEGFTTGTGVRIPFQIGKADSTKFLAGVSEALGGFGGFHRLFGAGMMVATLILLWYVSDIARSWIFNSGKH